MSNILMQIQQNSQPNNITKINRVYNSTKLI